MKAVVLRRNAPVEDKPLGLIELPEPRPGPGEVLVRVAVCGVCHTELDEIEGRLAANLPVVPGHQVVGRVVAQGNGAARFAPGERVGIAWLHSTCGECRFCRGGSENLCPDFRATGCDANGGYAEYITVPEFSAYPIPERFSDSQAAPLLCAGAIGFRSFRLSNIEPGGKLGLFGFGASAHIVLQIARHTGCRVFVFTRGAAHRRLALDLGAEWAGTPDDKPPVKIDAAIDFTPVGATVPAALEVLEKGGRLAIAVIRKRDSIPPLEYSQVWYEREIKSVANITRRDAQDFLALAAQIPILPEVAEFPLAAANEVLIKLKHGEIRGAAVLRLG